jgi:glyoxylase-like metal-dependent hydrolase (beta-lactamase superfamily II)
VLHTEGHARHHYCLNDPQSRGVFTGDSFGISYRELDTKNGEFIYPTTTPPHFDPAEAHKAIDRIMELRPERLYLTHYSRVDDLERLADDMHDCIDGFVAIAERHREAKDRCDAIQADMFDFLANRLATHGYAGDRDAMWSVMQFDVKLNSQGLDTWLSWLERQQ